jgi:hypothetical protein
MILDPSWRLAKNFGEPLMSYTTLLLERAAEADLPTARQQIILAREIDAPVALAALEQAGIRALIS